MPVRLKKKITRKEKKKMETELRSILSDEYLDEELLKKASARNEEDENEEGD